MDVVTKNATASIAPVESAHPNGEFDLILSTDDLDRDGENLYAEDWAQPLPDHLHFDTDHAFNRDQSVPFTAGSGVPRIENGQLRVRGTYAGTEHGQLVRQLVNEGHIRTASVAYTEHKGGKRELLNGSFVGVPANPKAKILSSKSLKAASNDDDTPPEEDDQTDGIPPPDQLVQAAHDAMVHLGAECYAPDADDGESDGANKSFHPVLVQLVGEAVLKTLKDSKKPYGNVAYADPAGGKYPIDTEEHVRAALSYFGMPKNRAQYGPAEQKTIQGRIDAAARKFGIDVDKSSDGKSVGSSQKSPDDTAPAPAVKAAAAVDESADDAAQRARMRAFHLKMSMGRTLDET